MICIIKNHAKVVKKALNSKKGLRFLSTRT